MSDLRMGDLLDLLDLWRHFPKYQLERQAGMFFAMFLPDVLEAHYGIEFNREVIPEFPLRHGTLGTDVGKIGSNQSVNVDYAAFTRDGQKVFFVELKTDANSRRTKQDRYLEKAAGLEFKTLVQGIGLIRKVSPQRRKYDVLLHHLSELGVGGISHKPEVVYIQPRCNESRDDEKYGDCICFGKVAEVVEKRGRIGERFACSLREWANVRAGWLKGC